MSCVFGEGKNERFEGEEKRFQSQDSKVKFFHIFSKNRIEYIFSSRNSRDITILCVFKTIRRKHQFSAKANLLYYNGTTQAVGYVIENTNNVMQVVLMDENDDIIISVSEGMTKENAMCMKIFIPL